MKRKDGYLILDESVEVLEKYASGAYNSCLYKLNVDNEDYFFKCQSEVTRYMELFVEQVATFLQIKTVHNDLAKYKNNFGIISKSCNVKHKKEIRISEIVNIYRNEIINPNWPLFIHSKNNDFYEMQDIESIWWALLYYYRKLPNNNEKVQNIIADIMNAFYLQIIVGNGDLHLDNLSIFDDDENPQLFPNYDFELCGLVNLDETSFSSHCYNFKCIEDSEDMFPILNVVKCFLDFSDELSINKLEAYVNKLLAIDPHVFLNIIEEQTSFPIEGNVQDYLLRYFSNNLIILQNLIHSKKFCRQK